MIRRYSSASSFGNCLSMGRMVSLPTILHVAHEEPIGNLRIPELVALARLDLLGVDRLVADDAGVASASALDLDQPEVLSVVGAIGDAHLQREALLAGLGRLPLFPECGEEARASAMAAAISGLSLGTLTRLSTAAAGGATWPAASASTRRSAVSARFSTADGPLGCPGIEQMSKLRRHYEGTCCRLIVTRAPPIRRCAPRTCASRPRRSRARP